MTSSAPPGGPDWVRETIAVTRDEIRRFAATAAGVCLQPRRFGAAWIDGTRRALNPLGFVATALGVSGAALAIVFAVIPNALDQGLLAQVAVAVLPYVYYALIGALAHPVLRLFGARRPLRATIGMTLFAGGGPGLLLTVSFIAIALGRVAAYGGFDAVHGFSQGLPVAALVAIAISINVLYLYFVATLALGLAGAHGVGRIRAAGAVAVALLVTGLVIGLTGVQPPVPVLAVFPQHWPPTVTVMF
jgi:hypothetical protein